MRDYVLQPVVFDDSMRQPEPTTPVSILGSLLVEYWDARHRVTLVSGEVDAWTGYRGTVLSAAGAGNRMLYEADGTDFKGRPVLKSSATGPRYLQNLAATAVWADGTSPYILGVLRVSAHGSSNRWVMRNLNAASSQGGPDIFFQTAGATFSNAMGASVAFGASTTVHALESWLVAATSTALSVDGVDTVVPDAGATITGARTQLSVGASGGGGNSVAASHAAYVLCSSVPSVGQRAALRVWAQQTWGTP